MSRTLLIAPLLLFLGVTYLVPLAGVLLQSVTVPEPGLQNYQEVLGDPLVWSVIWRTLRICLFVTVLATVLAYPLTMLWVRGRRPVQIVVELCIMIPFWLSVLSRTFGWLSMLSNRGLLNTWLKDLGIIDMSLTMVRNDFGVIVGMVHFLIPFAVFPLASAMRNMDERVLMAARGIGASRFRVFWQIFVPMTWGGIMGAALLVFVFSIGFYVVPTLLGGGRSVMIAELIYLRIFQIPDWGIAAALSALIMVAVGGFLVTIIRRTGVGSQ
ncbi:ABC transporter permease [Pseudooceanicola sp. HF7]|uniref:ABC transporter permease n=1 Tax=Pseudooceanicola sp. HF7 TaxID=2721560 RepID=UPI001430B29F|nr:ABC transporter permease [Pseudooceanicola sp. HF7]NIZ11362.1 ABC transporter permease [Pseudooceanicola sp. HF7]